MNAKEYFTKFDEPSVLDVLKEKFRLLKIPQFKYHSHKHLKKNVTTNNKPNPRSVFPWRTLVVIITAIIGQNFLEPGNKNFLFGAILYGISLLFLFYAIAKKEWMIPPIKPDTDHPLPLQAKRNPFLIGLIFILAAFLLFGGNQFNLLNISIWMTALILSIWALWTKPTHQKSLKHRIMDLKEKGLSFHIPFWGLFVILIFMVALFFRVNQLDQVPGEMFSDHAEKLLDVSEILHGQFSIFFPRNTGREAFQFYLTALISIITHTGISFVSLKIGTVLIGLMTLPFIYLLGKEIGNRWIGLLALLMAGIAYWPNVISRIGLRYSLEPMFVAPTLYYLIKGIRYSNRNDFILSGVFLGLGLHGYSSFRVVPFVVMVAYLIFFIHKSSRGRRVEMLFGLGLVVFFSFILFLPLLRYFLSNPATFNYRILSRITTTEQAFPGNPLIIFFENLWKALIMFFVDNGSIWVHSIPGRPALDLVMAVFYFIGAIVLFSRYLTRKNWVDLFILLSIPLLLLPSILSLAFPGENPSLNRTAGAIVPVFIICSIGFLTAIQTLWNRLRTWIGKFFVVILTGSLLIVTMSNNYTLVFREYDEQYMQNALNTSDIGRVIRGFVDTIGTRDTAYVVPYPYWVDTRLVGINAGFPTKDYALAVDGFDDTLSIQKSKLFILNTEDLPDLDLLHSLYPNGDLYTYKDKYPGKDFIMFIVPWR